MGIEYEGKTSFTRDELDFLGVKEFTIPKKIDYKFNEGELLQEITNYINATYSEHYSKSKFQATEFIIDAGHGDGFCIGNVMKYAQRYGKKNGYNRADLLKIIHYAIIELHVHDKEGR